METIYFLSGVGAVLLILSIVFVSGLAKRVSKLESSLIDHEHSIEGVYKEISERDIQTNLRIDREIDRTDKMCDELHRDLNKNLEEVYRDLSKRAENIEQAISNEAKDIYSTIDSRVDKLEQKLTSVNKDGCEPTKKILKG
jgi:biopolymer transport protein ExbB/TolQ